MIERYNNENIKNVLIAKKENHKRNYNDYMICDTCNNIFTLHTKKVLYAYKLYHHGKKFFCSNKCICEYRKNNNL